MEKDKNEDTSASAKSSYKSCYACVEDSRNNHLTFHKVPKNDAKRRLWMASLKSSVPLAKKRKTVIVCSNHFWEDDYEVVAGKKILKNSAIPSKFTSSLSAEPAAVALETGDTGYDLEGPSTARASTELEGGRDPSSTEVEQNFALDSSDDNQNLHVNSNDCNCAHVATDLVGGCDPSSNEVEQNLALDSADNRDLHENSKDCNYAHVATELGKRFGPSNFLEESRGHLDAEDTFMSLDKMLEDPFLTPNTPKTNNPQGVRRYGECFKGKKKLLFDYDGSDPSAKRSCQEQLPDACNGVDEDIDLPDPDDDCLLKCYSQAALIIEEGNFEGVLAQSPKFSATPETGLTSELQSNQLKTPEGRRLHIHPDNSSTPISTFTDSPSPTKSALKRSNEEMKNKFVDTLSMRMYERFSVLRFITSDKDIQFYTGFRNYATLHAFFQFLYPDCLYINYLGSRTTDKKSPTKRQGRTKKLLLMDELFLTLIRLRKNYGLRHLGNLFLISESQTGRIINSWILFMSHILGQVNVWPPGPPTEKLTFPSDLPDKFREEFGDTITILDCTELYIQRASASGAQRETFSSYKHHVTLKGMLGIDLNGAIVFISRLYAGKTGDKKLFVHSGILELLKDGDAVMVDKGFLIEKECTPHGVKVHIPFFKDGNKAFTEEQNQYNESLARIRVHVERAMKKVKEFEILSSEIPITLMPMMDHMWLVCCMLSNFNGSLIYE